MAFSPREKEARKRYKELLTEEGVSKTSNYLGRVQTVLSDLARESGVLEAESHIQPLPDPSSDSFCSYLSSESEILKTSVSEKSPSANDIHDRKLRAIISDNKIAKNFFIVCYSFVFFKLYQKSKIKSII